MFTLSAVAALQECERLFNEGSHKVSVVMLWLNRAVEYGESFALECAVAHIEDTSEFACMEF